MPGYAQDGYPTYETYEADFFTPEGNWVGSEPITIAQGHDFEGSLADAFRYRHRTISDTLRMREHKRGCVVVVADDARLGHPIMLNPLD